MRGKEIEKLRNKEIKVKIRNSLTLYKKKEQKQLKNKKN